MADFKYARIKIVVKRLSLEVDVNRNFEYKWENGVIPYANSDIRSIKPELPWPLPDELNVCAMSGHPALIAKLHIFNRHPYRHILFNLLLTPHLNHLPIPPNPNPILILPLLRPFQLCQQHWGRHALHLRQAQVPSGVLLSLWDLFE